MQIDIPTQESYITAELSRLPPIQPTRAINTSLRFLTNILPTKLTLHLLLHDIVITRP